MNDTATMERPKAAAKHNAPPTHMWVIDPTIRPGGEVNQHQMPNADGSVTDYNFEYNKPLKVLSAHAMRFLRNGFKVSANKEMNPLIPQARSAVEGHDGHNPKKLQPYEIIASLHELRLDALYKRAAALPGGDALKADSPASELVAFIEHHNRQILAERAKAEQDDLIPDNEGGVSLDEQRELTEAYGDDNQL